jgi:folate-dependent phosphoribosylglycinamide formyltransferase PurN
MKIVFFITKDPYIYSILEKVIIKLDPKHSIEGIVEFPPTLGKVRGLRISYEYAKLFGIKDSFKILAENSQYIKQVKELAKLNDIPFFVSDDPNDKYLIQWVKDNNIDIIFNFVGYILKEDIINAPKKCIVNKHSSILPGNRGILPVFWAMLNGDKIGYTLHKINKNIDDGEIVVQRIYRHEEIHSLYEWYKIIHDDINKAIIESIDVIDGSIPQIINNKDIISSYHGLPTKDDIKKFREMGLRII